MNTIDQVVTLKEQENSRKSAQKSQIISSKPYTSLGWKQSTDNGKQKKKFIRVNGSLEEQGCIEIINMKWVPKESPNSNLWTKKTGNSKILIGQKKDTRTSSVSLNFMSPQNHSKYGSSNHFDAFKTTQPMKGADPTQLGISKSPSFSRFAHQTLKYKRKQNNLTKETLQTSVSLLSPHP